MYPDFYGNFIAFSLLKTHYFKEYRVQVNGYFLIQGWFKAVIHAESANGNFSCKEYSPCVNSVVYTIG